MSDWVLQNPKILLWIPLLLGLGLALQVIKDRGFRKGIKTVGDATVALLAVLGILAIGIYALVKFVKWSWEN